MSNSEKPISKTFKQTQQLVNIALKSDDWNQLKIAKHCRTQQSVVSAWKNGERKAKLEVIKPLLKIFSSELRRESFRLYYNYAPAIEEQRNSSGDVLQDRQGANYRIFKVEGKVLFSHSFGVPIRDLNSPNSKKINFPIYKVAIHKQGSNKFLCITQQRTKLSNDMHDLRFISSSDEEASWSSTASKPIDAENLRSELRKIAGGIVKSELIRDNIDYAIELVSVEYRLTKALLNEGIPVEGIETYEAEW